MTGLRSKPLYLWLIYSFRSSTVADGVATNQVNTAMSFSAWAQVRIADILVYWLSTSRHMGKPDEEAGNSTTWYSAVLIMHSIYVKVLVIIYLSKEISVRHSSIPQHEAIRLIDNSLFISMIYWICMWFLSNNVTNRTIKFWMFS